MEQSTLQVVQDLRRQQQQQAQQKLQKLQQQQQQQQQQALGASSHARADWLAGKLQQQQDAAAALEHDFEREQQLLQKLADKQLAAKEAHAQAMQDVRQVCRVFWSRQPDDWDAKWEAEEQARRLQSQQAGAQRLSAEEAAWQQQVDAAHQQLLNQQKQRAALRSRIEQDARSAKAEQLRRIEPIAKARARAQGLASLGLDPEIMSLSEKFGQLSGLVDEVQRSMEAQYGLQDGALAAVPGQTWQQQLLPVFHHRKHGNSKSNSSPSTCSSFCPTASRFSSRRRSSPGNRSLNSS
ncbi:hypothetical protein COO60DRAFT_1700022 [Scenedesmus sp. NREL 46B-D3]|nr:hypothetical protein COO60DRAFT_1700022 [Scenedesmus sp. NREL 46B-D3]